MNLSKFIVFFTIFPHIHRWKNEARGALLASAPGMLVYRCLVSREYGKCGQMRHESRGETRGMHRTWRTKIRKRETCSKSWPAAFLRFSSARKSFPRSWMRSKRASAVSKKKPLRRVRSLGAGGRKRRVRLPRPPPHTHLHDRRRRRPKRPHGERARCLARRELSRVRTRYHTGSGDREVAYSYRLAEDEEADPPWTPAEYRIEKQAGADYFRQSLAGRADSGGRALRASPRTRSARRLRHAKRMGHPRRGYPTEEFHLEVLIPPGRQLVGARREESQGASNSFNKRRVYPGC